MFSNFLKPSFVERLRVAPSNHKNHQTDPWTSALRISAVMSACHDGVERIATDAVFEQLDLPPLKQTPEAAKRLRLPTVDMG